MTNVAISVKYLITSAHGRSTEGLQMTNVAINVKYLTTSAHGRSAEGLQILRCIGGKCGLSSQNRWYTEMKWQIVPAMTNR